MRSYLLKLSVGICLLGTGCAYPGKLDLVEKGYMDSFTVLRDHKQLAECVTRTLDDEPRRLGEMQLLVTRATPSADGNSIDLQGGMTDSPTILLWSASITKSSPEQSKVEVIGRRGAYLAQIKRTVEGCGKA